MDARVILKWILETWGRELWAGFIWIRTGASCGHFSIVKNLIARWKRGGGDSWLRPTLLR